MKQQVYVSWCEGLPQSREALNIIKDSGIVSGVEVRPSSQEEIALIKSAGLKVSLHQLPPKFRLGLADLNFIKFFETEHGIEVLESIRNSDSPTVGFHLSAFESSFSDEQDLLETVANNLFSLDAKINKNVLDMKNVIVESQPLRGSNIFKRRLTDPLFIKSILELSGLKSVASSGYLLDTSHNFITAKDKIRRGLFLGSVSEYFNDLVNNLSGKIYQLHINVPSKVLGFYFDSHRTFKKGDKLSEEILDLTKSVIQASPELKVITLEMTTGMEPVLHAKEMVNQTEFLLNRLA